MKTKYYSIAALGLFLVISACSKSDPTPAVVTYNQEDQMGRPAINTVFVIAANKDTFNGTIPSAQNAAFASAFKSQLLALNPGYTTNLLGLSATDFASFLATDVLSVSLTGITTIFYDGTNSHTLTGRRLTDDVITVELKLIFGGPVGSSNPALTDDHVDANDQPFINGFPYLAAAN